MSRWRERGVRGSGGEGSDGSEGLRARDHRACVAGGGLQAVGAPGVVAALDGCDLDDVGVPGRAEEHRGGAILWSFCLTT